MAAKKMSDKVSDEVINKRMSELITKYDILDDIEKTIIRVRVYEILRDYENNLNLAITIAYERYQKLAKNTLKEPKSPDREEFSRSMKKGLENK